MMIDNMQHEYFRSFVDVFDVEIILMMSDAVSTVL
jgi:hypothetical protein